MKIMQIIPNFDMGGAETMCEGLAVQLKRLGHDVVAVSLYDCDTAITHRLSAAGIRVLFPGKKPGLDLGCALRLRQFIRKEKPDVIHTHLHALKYTFLAAFGTGIPMVHTVHNVADREAGPDRALNQQLYRFHRVVPVSLSREVQKSVMNFYSLTDTETPVILNGIDLGNCIPKRDYTLHSPVNILHVGRFYEQKNHPCMVEAMELLKEQDITLTFVGDGPLMEQTRKLVGEKGLTDKIHFYGLTDRVFPLLREADIFILPSLWEGLPMTVIEAMGTGLPIIASNVGGLSDMIQSGHSGILIQPDPQKLADAILKLIANDALRSQMGKNAMAQVGKFSSQAMARRYLDLYTTLAPTKD